MNCEYELNFFCDVLKKCHVNVCEISLLDSAETVIDPRLRSIIGFDTDRSVQHLLGRVENHTKYMLTDEFKLQYIYMRLPLLSESNILFVGPYLSAPLSSKDILEIGERAGLSFEAQKLLKEYYLSIPILLDSDKIFALVDIFCERVWQTQSFEIVEVNKNHRQPTVPIEAASRGESFDEIEAGIKMMESRYAFENELIRAVSLGQQHKGQLLVSRLNEQLFERRVADPLRNTKNYCIIMNTLLRKAAEEGGVHPIYIDKASSKFAMKIELLSTTKACKDLMIEMFSSYCRLVYKSSMKGYSPIVKKTILIIDSDISAALSLSSLAQKQGISAGYLATIFKKETQKTVSEYITDKRMEHAMYLLNTTHLQIQTVALHCGIVDVQHFSKVFKKKTGKTPREYREATHR